ncbi:endoribonuclease Dicer homolog 1 [Selaginella moellendorffii]|nr:endoribonuclease Dicer homolog 1 [Selaginella moellendorffii]|eukprot:XP_002989272.2 endoribonuclease Dicer homolog 1 [Selaginella moellendorffii]
MLLANPLPCFKALELQHRFSPRIRALRSRWRGARACSSSAPFETSKWNLVVSFVVFFCCYKSGQQQQQPWKRIRDEQEEFDAGFIHNFSELVSKGTEKLPHLRNRVERMMQAIQLRKAINYNIPASKILEALTAANCHEPYCYERIELLGDAYLKWAVSTRLYLKFSDFPEGELTITRGKIISNSALHYLALEKGLETYVRINPFVPGREPTDLQELSSKVLANVVEALIGAYYVHHGDKGARHVVEWLGIETGFSDAELQIARAGSVVSPEVLNSIDFEGLENTLGYSFGSRNLLAQALTHSSSRQASMVPIYERLEFIGDAVLDHLLTRHIYFSYKDLHPGRLTDLRCAALNSESFARAMVKHKLHAHILHESNDFHSQIKTYAKHALNMEENAIYSYGFGAVKAPKVLGDVFQSLVGALYIDSGLNLDQVWKVFEPLLQPLVTPEAVPIHPVRELYELCDKHMKKLEWDYSLSGDLFLARALVGNKVLGRGTNVQKKMAKKLAAINAIAKLDKSASPLTPSQEEKTSGEFSRQALHELCSQRGWPCPDYNTHSETGPAHAKMFTCTASVRIEQGEKQECIGQPRPTINKAKDSAARMLMETLQKS